MYMLNSGLDPNICIDLRYQLKTYRDIITTQFASYVSEIYIRIKVKKIDLDQIKQFLENKLDSDLEEANSLHDIFRLIRKRGKTSFNFLNYPYMSLCEINLSLKKGMNLSTILITSRLTLTSTHCQSS